MTLSRKFFAVSAGLLGVAAVAAVVAIAPSQPGIAVADPCPTNETSQIHFDGCLPSIDAPQAQVYQRGPDQLPEVRGIPCDGSDTGTCIGLSQLPGGTPAQPDATASQPDTQVRSAP
ncbi:hypothetical protein ACXDF8_14835 [Mycolicibacterium sp. CBM1]